MATSAPKNKTAPVRSSAHASSLPAPYQLAIEDVAFRMTVLDDHVARDHDRERPVRPPSWFSVTLTAPLPKRYLYLVQQELDTGLIVLILLFDRAAVGDAYPLRLPPSGAWLRAVVDGQVHVVASDLVLTRTAITAWIGGGDPPTSPALPPYT